MYRVKNNVDMISQTWSRGKHTGKVIAIRREDQSVWERRAALAPSNVKRLVRSGVKVIVQPSNRRAYPVQPLDFLPGFSFEGFANRDSLRYAQLYNIAAEAHTVVRGTLRYRGFVDAMQAIQKLGLLDLKEHPALHPSGPEICWKVAEHGSNTKIYACEVRRRNYLERIKGGGYDYQEYNENPSLYRSLFASKIAPYASIIINGIYWAVGSPKLLTLPDAKNLLRPNHMPWLPTSDGAPPLPHRLLGICDISADPGGSIEFMNECTTIDTPFWPVGNTGLEALEALGLLNDDIIVQKQNTPIDTLSHFLRQKLVLDDGDRDVIVLRHDIDILWPNRSRERKSISLVVYGQPNGTTAMAKTVGLPAAIAAKMILEGEIQTKGMVLPLTPDVYRPLLLRLKQEGIVAREHSFSLDKN
ncbi:alpha-aminoadipic semialdehyde synthase, mitochondrial-like [Diaphorina citri]|uniref:Alpha-aminoadipic semialdehyde synthase, mitochondrial-like n=1 Tax=Diaphorina citri TaxID=121845 RepID=A0A1S3CYL9_DIACI|nr:alpha-aminoadipic semialdehyde synthase, mitochondrial-like [Diaphorina citri]